ncbi:hypothetical protein, partial [Methyloversatilis discipulorum]|uniref:hypothetical protein n=1 Tax=Methyloversatilis discipulorum TaxID=1119528 RepID=UPI003AF518AA
RAEIRCHDDANFGVAASRTKNPGRVALISVSLRHRFGCLLKIDDFGLLMEKTEAACPPKVMRPQYDQRVPRRSSTSHQFN